MGKKLRYTTWKWLSGYARVKYTHEDSNLLFYQRWIKKQERGDTALAGGLD